MIQPDGLLDHALVALAGSGPGRPPEVDLRRGVSAAYYAVFHDLTDRAARHLIGSAPEGTRNKIRRTWSHGELSTLAEIMVDRAPCAGGRTPQHRYRRRRARAGPLVDLAAADPDLVEALRLFGELQAARHRADYDHDARFDKVTLLTACRDAATARGLATSASAASREALFTLLTLRRSDFKER
ncbi:MAG: hypothetical protein U5R31_08570 [Acidimicrobiia bacterium]|nr:hypothetical protein [Acidimicrobiia bacterium]